MEILLESELNSGNRYRVFQDEYDKTRKTLMHYAAEKHPQLMTMTTDDQLAEPVKKRAMLPVELAMEGEKDNEAAFLIRVMSHER